MTSPQSAVDLLVENGSMVFRSVAEILLHICDNILNSPQELKYRRLRLSNPNVVDKLLPAIGAIECLFEMGFEEAEDSFVLPGSAPLSRVKITRDRIAQKLGAFVESKKATAVPCSNIAPRAKPAREPNLPQSHLQVRHPFYQRIEGIARSVRRYEDPAMQAKALACVPEAELWQAAQNRLRTHQFEKASVGEVERQGLPDLFLNELLGWFKYNFFSWVDKPACKICKSATSYIGPSHNPAHRNEAPNTELYSCVAGHVTPFHRYADPARLLETREGRCGEWATCFTLICRGLGLDARQVFDETDHVWTEVWSVTQARWLHCDACEAICDAPLTYQAGWGKKLSYVIAYSKDGIQDVTWRYTQEPMQEVLARRHLCQEAELQMWLLDLQSRLQHGVSPARQKFLQRRLLGELAEFLRVPGQQRELGSAEIQGRISGSAEWRAQRGETGHLKTSWLWRPSTEELRQKVMSMQYSTAQNLYRQSSGEPTLQNWSKGVFQAKNITRKEEKDWDMTYLARTEGTTEAGWVEWRFEIPSDSGLEVSSVQLLLPSNVFNSGSVRWRVTGDSTAVEVSSGEHEVEQLAGSHSVVVRADLTGGEGTVAWQHAQVARQSLGDKSFPLQVTITLRDKAAKS